MTESGRAPRDSVTRRHASLRPRPDRSWAWQEIETAVERTLDELRWAELFSGAVLLRLGDHARCFAIGTADRMTGTQNTAATRFNTASITKLFTAVAVARLWEAGRLDVHRPVGTWLGHGAVPALDVLTPHHLLLHTGGFPEDAPEVEGWDACDWLVPLRGVRLLFAPGTGWHYSNAGYAVLGALIEAVTGRPYFEAMGELVFAPAGMAATAFDDAGDAGGHAIGYAYGNHEERPSVDNLSAGLGRGAPYGYAHSTVADIDRLLDAIVAHDIVGPRAARRLLRGSQPTTEASRRSGYGAFTERSAGRLVTTSSGAGPGISAWLDDVPELRYRAVVLSNHPKPAAHRVGRFIRSLIVTRAARR